MKDDTVMSSDSARIGTLRVICRTLSDVGRVRQNNEDALIAVPRIGLFGVCDGLGGHAAGEVASDIASQTLEEVLAGSEGESSRGALARSVHLANERILRQQAAQPEQQGMGTTVSLLWIRGEAAGDRNGSTWVAHIGDSRIYRWREGELKQITTDHSPVYRLHQQGFLTKDQIRRHPQKNLLDRSLGISGEVEPDIFPISIQNGDRFLICTDGLSDALSDEEIAARLGDPDLETATRALVSDANDKGGLDNITLAVLEVSKP